MKKHLINIAIFLIILVILGVIQKIIRIPYFTAFILLGGISLIIYLVVILIRNNQNH